MKLLFVTARFPYPPLKGDQLVPYHRLRHFSRKHNITLLSFTDKKPEPQHLTEVRRYCSQIRLVPLRKIESLANIVAKGLCSVPLQVLYFKSRRFKRNLDELLSQNKYDLVHAFMLRMAPYVSTYHGCPKIIELIDSMELNAKRRASAQKGLARWVFRVEAKRLSVYERTAAGRFDYAVVVSQLDKDVIGRDNVVVSPNGVDTEAFYPAAHGDKDRNLIVFTGNMGYFPNQQAVLYFADEVFPLIKNKHPEAKFWVLGCAPPRKLQRLQTTNKSIRILGHIDSMAEYINKAAVAVCPMKSGSGIQNKILEALACGVPVVATSMGKGDLKLGDDDGLFIADTAASSADTLLNIMANDGLRTAVAEKGPRAVRREYSWEKSNSVVEELYRRLLQETDSKGPRATAPTNAIADRTPVH